MCIVNLAVPDAARFTRRPLGHCSCACRIRRYIRFLTWSIKSTSVLDNLPPPVLSTTFAPLRAPSRCFVALVLAASTVTRRFDLISCSGSNTYVRSVPPATLGIPTTLAYPTRCSLRVPCVLGRCLTCTSTCGTSAAPRRSRAHLRSSLRSSLAVAPSSGSAIATTSPSSS